MNTVRYRADIDGLRGIAVLSVLFFHIDLKFFGGGYIGVDVFFVISGFLITRLIRDEVLKSQNFSFSNFYMRRARRLLPSLFFTLVVSFIAAFILFPPYYMERFSGSLFNSVSFTSNFFFWRESGYFDTSAIYKPLLHIWSLSVEEQFYFLWPLLLVVLLRKTPNYISTILILASGAFSLYLNYVFADGQSRLLTILLPSVAELFTEGPSTIFYLAPFRIFEFMIGALLVWLIRFQPKNKIILEPFVWIGLSMIAYSVITYTDKMLYPSYNALIPCLGTALLLYSGTAKYSGKLLNNPLLVFLGLISYSLYLIHWPLIVFYKYYKYDFDVLNTSEQLFICAAAILLAGLMYQVIEQPFRIKLKNTNRISSQVFIFTFAPIAAIVLTMAASAWTNNGWEWRKPSYLSLEEINNGKERRNELFFRSCNILDTNGNFCHPDAELQVLFLGNSHHNVGYNVFYEAFQDQTNSNLITFGPVNQCEFKIKDNLLIATGMGWKNKGRCQERVELLNSRNIYEKLDVLVISSFQIFTSGIQEFEILKYLKSKNNELKIVIIGPYIGIRPYECADIINRFGSSNYCKERKFVSYFGDNIKYESLYNAYSKYDFLLIDTVNMLCNENLLANCVTEVDGVPMFYDGDHISLEFSFLISRRMLEEYQSELEEIGFKSN